MPATASPPPIRLPKDWPRHIKSALLHAIALARTAVTCARASASQSKRCELRLQAELDRANNDTALFREELAIKDARWSRLPSRRRPWYTPIQRMRILQLKAVRGWTSAQAARVFLLDEETVASWMRRVDEQGEHALIQIPKPVNRFPDFVRHLVRQLKVLLPAMGKVRIAQTLARAGLHLGVMTVSRMIKEARVPSESEADALEEDEVDVAKPRVVTAKYPGNVWHLDLSTIPTGTGFWVPWFPFTWAQSWPFCWWVCAVVDHFSRSVVGFAVFPKKPTSIEVRAFLGRAIRSVGKRPKYIIADQDKAFNCRAFKAWCRRRDILPRYGAVGKHGSIAVIERFIRSLKAECTRRLRVPLRVPEIRKEIALFCLWYNEFRPHRGLEGRTPREVRDGLPPANATRRLEPRRLWPLQSPCARPHVKVDGRRGARFQLVIAYLEGRKHLPIVALRRAA